MRKKKGLLSVFGERLDLPSEMLPGGFSLTLCGQGELMLCGCCRILSYSESCIELLLASAVLRVTGEGLLCTAFDGGTVTLGGHICSISFEEEEKRAH